MKGSEGSDIQRPFSGFFIILSHGRKPENDLGRSLTVTSNYSERESEASLKGQQEGKEQDCHCREPLSG